MLTVSLSYMSFIMLSYIAYLICWEFLSWKDTEFFQIFFLYQLILSKRERLHENMENSLVLSVWSTPVVLKVCPLDQHQHRQETVRDVSN